MSNLVDHARRELAAINEDPEHTQGILNVVQAFADMGCSGGQAAVAIHQISELLEFHNLSPLTDDPNEWYHHEMDSQEDFWQNKRRGEAFSHDGGRTYYLLSEGASDKHRSPMHTSRPHKNAQNFQEDLFRQEVDGG